MATQPIAAEAANTNSSLILAIHSRFEASWAEYNRVDEAQPAKPKSPIDDPEAWRLWWRCDRGMKQSYTESRVLRRAILWQVPSTFEEATVLAFHLNDLGDAATDLSEQEREDWEVGMASLFDFLVGEGCASMEKMGDQFSAGAMFAFEKRRTRTGQVSED